MGRAIGLLVASTGVAFAVAALGCDVAWFQRHIALPCFYPAPPPWLHSTIRVGLAAVALVLLAAARPLGRRATGAGSARVGLAVLLALGAAEWMLRHFDWTAHAVRSKRLEYQIGREDARRHFECAVGLGLQVLDEAQSVDDATELFTGNFIVSSCCSRHFWCR